MVYVSHGSLASISLVWVLLFALLPLMLMCRAFDWCYLLPNAIRIVMAVTVLVSGFLLVQTLCGFVSDEVFVTRTLIGGILHILSGLFFLLVGSSRAPLREFEPVPPTPIILVAFPVIAACLVFNPPWILLGFPLIYVNNGNDWLSLLIISLIGVFCVSSVGGMVERIQRSQQSQALQVFGTILIAWGVFGVVYAPHAPAHAQMVRAMLHRVEASRYHARLYS
jgi:hypothetical protein